jgi:hypothetical protein
LYFAILIAFAILIVVHSILGNFYNIYKAENAAKLDTMSKSGIHKGKLTVFEKIQHSLHEI